MRALLTPYIGSNAAKFSGHSFRAGIPAVIANHPSLLSNDFTNVWTRNNQRNHDINLRNDEDYYLPQVNKEFFRRSTLYSIPNTWNTLGDIKFQQNRTTFKINLLYDLFESLTD